MFEADAAAQFPGLAGFTYLNTATMGVGPAASASAIRAAADEWASGRLDWVAAERAGEEARALFATLVNSTPDCVAIIPTAGMVAGLVAAHVRQQFPGGGSIVVGEQEFSSNLYAWRGLEAHGFDVRLLAFRGGAVPEADIAAAVDATTRVVAVSAVQSASGYRADIERIRAAAPHALLYVDAAQAAGTVPIDMTTLRIDALAAPSHKFLLGTRGMGYGAFSADLRDEIEPLWAGWKATASPTASFYGPEMTLSATASRLDASLAWINALAERASLGVMHELGFDRIHAHDAALARRLVEALRDANVPFLDHGPQHESSILSCAPGAADIAERLTEAGVVASVRGGRVRLAVHLYTTAAQVDAVAALLAS